MTSISVDCIWPIAAELGEGPVWCAAETALYFVDIKGRSIHSCDEHGRTRRSWPTPESIGFLQPMSRGGLVAGLKSGLHHFDLIRGVFKLALDVEPGARGNRLNDAFVDSSGCLWFGSMDDAERSPSGALYSIDDNGRAVCHDDGYVITNGPCKSPDEKTFFHTDTMKRIVFAFDVSEDGLLSAKRPLLEITNGYPDGTAVDADGCLWVALFGGGRVERYSPRGTLIQSVHFPCDNVTKVAFGGNDLRTVFVTTAWKGLSPSQRQAQPLAGGVFAFRSDTPGLPQHSVSRGFQREYS